MNTRNSGRKKPTRAIVLIFVLIWVFSPVQSSASEKKRKDSVPSCVACHVMEAQYEAWLHAGAHRRNRCVDCHLPNENVFLHYVWKSIDGLKDIIVFNSGRVPDRIIISNHGQEVLQRNCRRCHETAVMLMDQSRKCWGCHRRITHFHTGIRETL